LFDFDWDFYAVAHFPYILTLATVKNA